MKNTRKEWTKKLLAIALALTVAVTFVPLLGNNVYAEDEVTDGTDSSTVAEESFDTVDEEPLPSEPSEDVQAPENEADTVITEEESTDVEADVTAEEPATEDIASDEVRILSDLDLSDKLLSGEEASEPALTASSAVDNSYFSFNVTRKGRTVYINGAFKSKYSSRYFGTLYVDGYSVIDMSSYNLNKLENIHFNLDNVNSVYTSPGYHTVTVTTHKKNGTRQDDASATYRVGINSAPSAKGSFEFYHNYFSYMSPVDYNLVNYKLFMEYSPNGSTWYKYGPMNYLQSCRIGGLRANTNYRIRTYYGVLRGGEWFTGKEEGKVLNAGAYRTGVASKVAIKSIKVKATKVKKKKQKVYGYYTGLYLGKRTYYKYKLKIVVKLKKKPGTNGIWINGKKFKGNKKKYVIKLGTMTSYSKPKGKKYPVMIYTYYSNAYGGYSPLYTTKKKIK